MRFSKVLVALFGLLSMVFAQGSGTIAGTVTDVNGVALASAQVEARNTAAGASFRASASPVGDYRLASIPAGTYELTFTSPGLLPEVRKEIALAPEQTIRIDVRLADFPSLNTLGEDRAFFVSLLTPHAAPAGPAPRAPDGKPDFSGVWHPQRTTDSGKPEMTPWAAALTKERLNNQMKDYPGSRCLPGGLTVMGQSFPYRLVQTPALLVILYEDDLPRQIFLDGRSHPIDREPTWLGHSIGKWEGNTLVVDTVGFNDKTWIDGGGHPHTEKMHVTERFRRPDLGHLEIQLTIEDPGAYTKPWIIQRVSELAPNEEVGEYVCAENNQDVQHLVGK